MNSSDPVNGDFRLELASRILDGQGSAADLRELQAWLEGDAEFRGEYVRYANLVSALGNVCELEIAVGTDVLVAAELPVVPVERRGWLSFRRPVTVSGVMSGFLIGLLGTSLAWSMSERRLVATVEAVGGLADGGFDSIAGALPAGFPHAVSQWAGDTAEVMKPVFTVESADGRLTGRSLRFVTPGSDATAPDGPATSCDVFQIVDLRSLHLPRLWRSEASLELAAEFLDLRPARAEPRMSLFCQMFVFRGDPEEMHLHWPKRNGEALASAAAWHRSSGSGVREPVRLNARCFLPREADFVVVQLAARPDEAVADLGEVYVDEVSLKLRLQPTLPEREVLLGRGE
jgi:hypothetical protein